MVFGVHNKRPIFHHGRRQVQRRRHRGVGGAWALAGRMLVGQPVLARRGVVTPRAGADRTGRAPSGGPVRARAEAVVGELDVGVTRADLLDEGQGRGHGVQLGPHGLQGRDYFGGEASAVNTKQKTCSDWAGDFFWQWTLVYHFGTASVVVMFLTLKCLSDKVAYTSTETTTTSINCTVNIDPFHRTAYLCIHNRCIVPNHDCCRRGVASEYIRVVREEIHDNRLQEKEENINKATLKYNTPHLNHLSLLCPLHFHLFRQNA
jgi:hypothetical protein